MKKSTGILIKRKKAYTSILIKGSWYYEDFWAIRVLHTKIFLLFIKCWCLALGLQFLPCFRFLFFFFFGWNFSDWTCSSPESRSLCSSLDARFCFCCSVLLGSKLGNESRGLICLVALELPHLLSLPSKGNNATSKQELVWGCVKWPKKKKKK